MLNTLFTYLPNHKEMGKEKLTAPFLALANKATAFAPMELKSAHAPV
jgi:hypothetical protein